MPIEFNLLDGVGVNVRYLIRRDGKAVGIIRRTGSRNRIGIYSPYYGEQLGAYPNVTRAREAAATITYPDEQTIYETICQRIEPLRRKWMEREFSEHVYRAARDLANGSNSAQQRLIDAMVEIETFAKNRADTREEFLRNRAGRVDQPMQYPYYPEPPGE